MAALVATSPLGIAAVRSSPATPHPTLASVLLMGCAGALTCLGVLFVESLLRGEGLGARVWVREPRAQVTRLAPLGVAECQGRLAARLADLGFEHRTADSTDAWVIFKGRDHEAGSFAARPFLGFVRFEGMGPETRVSVELRLMETLVLETGERARLQRLANVLSLAEDDLDRVPWPFAVRSGIGLAVVAALLSVTIGATPPWIGGWCFDISLGALALLVPTVTHRDRSEGGFGWHLAGIWLALVPYVGWLGTLE